MEQSAKAPFWKPALIYGAILGFVGILLGVIFYFLNLTTQSWVALVSIAVSIAVMAYCLLAYRKEYLGGYASFGRIFVMALVIGIVASILSTIYTYVLHTVVDPDLTEKIRLMAEERIMNNPRIPESMYEDLLDRMEDRFTPARMTRMALIWGVAANAIIGLILAAFIKKNPPENPVA
jgi:hypothetical protein